MSLDFDVSKVKNHEVTTTDIHEDGSKKWHWRINNLIWASLMVDLGSITESNVEEWVWRLSFLKTINQSPFGCISVPKGNEPMDGLVHHNLGWVRTEDNTLYGFDGTWLPTARDIRDFVGLGVNVATKPRSAFVKRWTTTLSTEADLKAKRLTDALDDTPFVHTMAPREKVS